MKLQAWHHWIMAIIIGYVIGYYWRGLGNATLAKIMPANTFTGGPTA